MPSCKICGPCAKIEMLNNKRSISKILIHIYLNFVQISSRLILLNYVWYIGQAIRRPRITLLPSKVSAVAVGRNKVGTKFGKDEESVFS